MTYEKVELNTVNEPKAKLWDAEKTELSTENIDITKVMDIEIKLDRLLEKPSVVFDDLNETVYGIGTLFETTSINTFGFEKNKETQNDKYANFKP